MSPRQHFVLEQTTTKILNAKCFQISESVHSESPLPWNFYICSRTVSSQLKDSYALKHISENFPYTKYVPPCITNCQNYIAMYPCSQIAGRSRKTIGKMCSVVFLVFQTFSPQLENNNTLQWSFDNFTCMVTYILCIENCWNYTLMHSFLPLAGRLSYNIYKFHDTRIW